MIVKTEDCTWKHRRVFWLMRKKSLWILACRKILGSKVSRPSGLELSTLKKLQILQGEVLSGSYKPNIKGKASRLVSEEVSGFFGIDDFNEKVVQEIIWMILKVLFDSSFYSNNFGFKLSKGPHQALGYLERNFKYCRWICEINTLGFSESLDYNFLAYALEKRIEDKRFISLIKKFFVVDVVKKNLRVDLFDSLPRDLFFNSSQLASILLNIYLYEVDIWIRKRVPGFFVADMDFKHFSEKILNLVRKAMTLDKDSDSYTLTLEILKNLRLEQVKFLFSKMNKNLDLPYMRYRGHWVIGFEVKFSFWSELKDALYLFIRDTLKLPILNEVVRIVNLRRRSILFLGYNIFLTKCLSDPNFKMKQVRINLDSDYYSFCFSLPKDKITVLLKEKGILIITKAFVKAVSKVTYVSLTEDFIVNWFRRLWWSLSIYYSGLTSSRQLNYLYFLIRMSCAMTLAHKHKVSSKVVYIKKHNWLPYERLRIGTHEVITGKSSWFLRSRKWSSARAVYCSLKFLMA